MIESKDGRVSGSIDRTRVVELYAQTDDEDLKAHYREVLGDSEEGRSLDQPADEAQDEESQDAADETVTTTEAPEAPVATEADLDALRAQAEALGVKVDRRWGEQRLREEIDAAGEQ